MATSICAVMHPRRRAPRKARLRRVILVILITAAATWWEGMICGQSSVAGEEWRGMSLALTPLAQALAYGEADGERSNADPLALPDVLALSAGVGLFASLCPVNMAAKADPHPIAGPQSE